MREKGILQRSLSIHKNGKAKLKTDESGKSYYPLLNFSFTGLFLTKVVFQTKMDSTDASQNLFHTFILQIFIESVMGLQYSIFFFKI